MFGWLAEIMRPTQNLQEQHRLIHKKYMKAITDDYEYKKLAKERMDKMIEDTERKLAQDAWINHRNKEVVDMHTHHYEMAKLKAQPKDQLEDAYREYMEKSDEFHAKQQYADFVKAAMTAMIANPKFSEMQYTDVATYACNYADATLEEMTRRGK